MENKRPKMNLKPLDDIFSTQEERDNANLEKVIDIQLKDIDDFPNHPFKVIHNEEMDNMVESIKENGVLVPIIVRPKENGRYEMISGHRRKLASSLANKNTIPCIVRELTNDEATIIMVDSNMQREEIFPSEKAFAYKMKLDALNHQGKRNDLTSVHFEQKLDSRKIIAKENNESESKVYKFIRLTELIPELLDMVDNKIIALGPAVAISFLTKQEQQWLLESINVNLATPSLSQAQDMKNLSKNGMLTKDKMLDILSVAKGNQIEKIKIDLDSLRGKIPRNIPVMKYTDYIYKALEFYNRYLEKKKNMQER